MTNQPAISRRQLLALVGLGGLGLRALAHGSRVLRGPEHAPSHGHLKRFVPKIRIPSADERKIIEQRDRVRHRISRHLEKAKLRLARTPNAGSHAKHTALRRYMSGNTKLGGSDIDLPFVLTADSGDHLELKSLLELFEGFVRASYPRSKVTQTKSSVKLEFSTFKYAFDIVPMVAVRSEPRHEYLFRGDGSKVATSISAHVKFVKQRAQQSSKLPGIVNFNDMLRLFKWWRELRANADDQLTDVPTFLLELLCAKAFDEHRVTTSYTQTLQTWFAAIAEIVATRRAVRFDSTPSLSSAPWIVLDPVNPANNVVPRLWTDAHIDRLGRWFAEADAAMRRVQICDRDDDGKGALRELEGLFGPAIRNLELLEDEPFIAHLS